MPLDEITAISPKQRDTVRGMDLRTVARIAGVKTVTLYSWSQKGLIPGLGAGTRGLRRDIDETLALEIVVFAGLVRLGIGPRDAAQGIWGGPGPGRIVRIGIARGEEPRGGWGKPLTGIMLITAEESRPIPGVPVITQFNDLATLVAALQEEVADPSIPPQWRAPIFGVIDIDQLANQVRAAEEKWQETRRGRRTAKG